MSNDPQAFQPPITYTTEVDPTPVRIRAARHAHGDNAWLRSHADYVLRIDCYSNVKQSRRRAGHLYGVVFDRPGYGRVLKLAGQLRFEDSQTLNAVPIEGWAPAHQEHSGTCRCGRMHTVDLAKVRAAVDRLQSRPRKSRTVDVARLLTGV